MKPKKALKEGATRSLGNESDVTGTVSVQSSTATETSRPDSVTGKLKSPTDGSHSIVEPSEIKQTKGVIKVDENPFKLFGANILSNISDSGMDENENNSQDQSGSQKDGIAEKTDSERELEELEQHRAGWSAVTAGQMTVAQLCLLLGGPGKIVMEYNWVDRVEDQPLQGLGGPLNLPHSIVPGLPTSLTNMLRRLVHLATSEFSDFSKLKPKSIITIGSPPPKCATCLAAGNTPPPSRGRGQKAAAGNSPSTPKAPKTPTARQRAKTPTEINKPASDETATSVSTSSQTSTQATRSDDGVFRVPTVRMPSRAEIMRNNQADRNLMQQINNVNKRPDIFNNLLPNRRRRNSTRPVRRQLVVQRNILPKHDYEASGCHYSSGQIMGLSSETGAFVPLEASELLSDSPDPSKIIAQPIANTFASSNMNHSAAGAMNRGDANSGQQGAAHVNRTMSIGERLLVSLEAEECKASAAGTSQDPSQDPSQILKLAAEQASLISEDSRDSSVLTTDKNPVLGEASTVTSARINFSSTSSYAVTPSNTLSTSMMRLHNESLGDVAFNDASNMSNRSLNISSLLDISLPPPDGGEGVTDRFIDIALGNSNASFSALLENGNSNFNSSKMGETPTSKGSSSTAPSRTSFSQASQGGDPHWLAGEDLSLSNIFSELNKPYKGTSTVKKSSPPAVTEPILAPETSRDSIASRDVESALQSMMADSSLDFMAKFSLAEELDKDPGLILNSGQASDQKLL